MRRDDVLLRFRVTNHASIRDEAELSMIAAASHQDVAVQPIGDSGLMVLPAAAIYGANASGKSNLLDSIVFMRTAVLNSHQGWRPGSPIPRRSFGLDSAGRERPSEFIADFVLDGIRYEYGFSANDHRIISEWLYSYPKKRMRLLFERNEELEIKFGQSLGGLRQNIAKLTRPNSLYLSAAAANNHPQLTPIYEWFSYRVLPVRAGDEVYNSHTLHEWQHHNKGVLRDLLRFADTGVIDLEVEEQQLPDVVDEKFREFLKVYDPEEADKGHLKLPEKVEFIHRGKEGLARLAIDEESSGTLAWLLLIGPVAAAIRRGGVLIVDELDTRLHPLLAANLVSIFQNPEANTPGAQLIFNTHNVALLSPSVPRRLLRDQVWFTEKDDDGATRLVALAEYRVRDGLENIEKRYLGGRYGAIPFLDDTVLESLRSE